MARISGVNIPTNKKISIALTYIFGIGSKIAKDICDQAEIDKTKRVNELNDNEITKIRELVESNYSVEGDLRSQVGRNIKRLIDIGTYKGSRHKNGLPVNGQNTKNNARTRKGRKRTVANKKKAV